MKAVVITQFGTPDVLKVQERPQPLISSDEVLINVKAAGINRPDVFQRKGNYPAPEGASPDIPGLEVAGIIVSIGDQVTDWKIGDRVCALLSGGGYAEYAAVNAGQCLPVPENFSMIEAASLPETIFTVWSNVFQRGQLKPGENFLVHGGSSGIGITAIQLAKALGAKVFTTVGSDDKKKACLNLGADVCINYKKQDFEQELIYEGIDVILDMIGGDYFSKNLEVLRPDGRLVHINAMNGSVVELDIKKMMQKRITITGSTLRNREKTFKTNLTQEIKEKVWPILEAGNFNAVVYKTFTMEQADEAHELMESNQHIGKIVLDIKK